MFKKDERTVELYTRVGALMRIQKWIAGQIIIEGSKIMPSNESDRCIREINKFDAHFSDFMEEQMFKDHPRLSNAYLNAFYNGIECEEELKALVEAEVKRFEGVK